MSQRFNSNIYSGYAEQLDFKERNCKYTTAVDNVSQEAEASAEGTV